MAPFLARPEDRDREDVMRSPNPRRAGLAALAAVLLGADEPGPSPPPALKPALEALSGDDLLNHIKVLSSDAFEGRAPGTPGEEKAVEYLSKQFQALGLKPGNPDGTYVQDVPLVGYKATEVKGSVAAGGKTLGLKFPDDWVAVSGRVAKVAEVANSDVVFVGYGVEAPEFGWDDYKGVDVRGKTILMLINDPAVPDPNDPDKLDPNAFKGKAMTYYGRWTYKYEVASRKGAAAAIIVHETVPAAYPFTVVQGSRGRENFDIVSPGPKDDRTVIDAWITVDKAKEILSAAGQDFDALKKAAARKDFRPVALDARADLLVKSEVREIRSKNVLGKIEGSDPNLKDEYVVLTAHWDHLGKDASLTGDQVYNGAADNASGTAALLELARGFSRVRPAAKRSLLFLAVTAEEKGLLGAKYYAEKPLYPLRKTLLNVNMDVINLWGKTRDLTSLGLGQTSLDGMVETIAKAQGRTVTPDPEPEKGSFYRSDHFEFVKQGVPAVNLRGGIDYVGKPSGYGLAKRDEYTQKDYHKVTDEVKPGWDLSGAVDDLALIAEVVYRVAEGPTYPEWLPGTEFRAKREATLKASSPTRAVP